MQTPGHFDTPIGPDPFAEANWAKSPSPFDVANYMEESKGSYLAQSDFET